MPTRQERLASREWAGYLHKAIISRIESGLNPRRALMSFSVADLSKLRTFHHIWPRGGNYNLKHELVDQLARVYFKYVTPKSEKEALEIAAKSGDPVAKMALHDYEEEHS